MSWHVRYKLRGERSTDFVAEAALLQGQLQIAWQGQHFRKLRHRFRRQAQHFARSSADFVIGAARAQSQVQIS